MKKIITSIIIMIVLIFIGSQIVLESDSILKSVSFSFNIWINNIFPSLFPFFVLSEFLINYGFVEFLGELFKPIMNLLFKVKGKCSFIFIMSIISGIPANAKYVRELYLSGSIDEKESAKMLMFTHFSNPLFILGTISIINNASSTTFKIPLSCIISLSLLSIFILFITIFSFNIMMFSMKGILKNSHELYEWFR